MQHNLMIGMLAYVKEIKPVGDHQGVSFGLAVNVSKDKDEILPFDVWDEQAEKLSTMSKGDLVSVEYTVRRKGEENLDIRLVASYVRRLRKAS